VFVGQGGSAGRCPSWNTTRRPRHGAMLGAWVAGWPARTLRLRGAVALDRNHSRDEAVAIGGSWP